MLRYCLKLNGKRFTTHKTIEALVKEKKTLTNKEWLASLPAEKFYDEFKKIEHKMSFDINTRLAMIDWLNEEKEEVRIKDH